MDGMKGWTAAHTKTINSSVQFDNTVIEDLTKAKLFPMGKKPQQKF